VPLPERGIGRCIPQTFVERWKDHFRTPAAPGARWHSAHHRPRARASRQTEGHPRRAWRRRQPPGGAGVPRRQRPAGCSSRRWVLRPTGVKIWTLPVRPCWAVVLASDISGSPWALSDAADERAREDAPGRFVESLARHSDHSHGSSRTAPAGVGQQAQRKYSGSCAPSTTPTCWHPVAAITRAAPV
jgi:hypothetical protein